MPSYSALVLACTIVAAVRALPVDEISARNDIGTATSGAGGQAAGGSVSAAASRCISPFIECALSEVWGTSLLKMGSENAGSGGNALSGAPNGKALSRLIGGTNSTSKVPVGNGFSRAGGEAPGGSVIDSHPALIELGSDNAGQGGNASSGNSSGLVK